MAFLFGGVQKHFDSKQLSRHSISSSWILQNLITCLSMQALPKYISCEQSFCLHNLSVLTRKAYILSTLHC